MAGKRRVRSIAAELLTKSKEAALAAVQLFNNPQITFKSESFIVLMVIAWTYLLHSYYRRQKLDYRYFEQGPKRRRFDRTKHGGFKYWELERCLNEKSCPLDGATATNLRFLIGLRHEIEHQMTMRLDNYLSARYQACALNYNRYLRKLTDDKQSLDELLIYAIQFTDLTKPHLASTAAASEIPKRVNNYVAQFDATLDHEIFNDDRFAYRLLFKKKVVGKPNQADRVIEFIDPDSELAQQIDKEYWVKKEVERPKLSANQVLKLMHDEGFPRFNMADHTWLWKKEDGKNPGKGFGIQLGSQWWWYERWLDVVRQHCAANADSYR